MPKAVRHHRRQPENEQRQRRNGSSRGRRTLTRHRPLHPQRQKHAEREVRQVSGQCLRRDHAAAEQVDPGVPRHAKEDQPAEQHRLASRAAAAPAVAHRADKRQQGVEEHLEAQRPGDRVEGENRVRRVVLREEGEQGEVAPVRQPHARRAAGAPEEHERPEHRQVVSGQDARGAPQGVDAEVHGRVAAQRRPGEAAVEQIAREHEEEDQSEPEVREHVVKQARLPDPRGIRKAVQPYVEAQDRQGSEGAQPVEPRRAPPALGRRHTASVPSKRQA